MKYNKNKKGVSAIVATSLIILITVAAVTIVWTVVLPLIRDSTEGSVSCFNAASTITYVIDEGYTCYSNTGESNNDTIKVQIERGNQDVEFAGFVLRVTKDGNSVLIENKETIPSLNSKKVVSFTYPDDTTILSSDNVYEIAAIILEGNVERVCDDSFVTLNMMQCS